MHTTKCTSTTTAFKKPIHIVHRILKFVAAEEKKCILTIYLSIKTEDFLFEQSTSAQVYPHSVCVCLVCFRWLNPCLTDVERFQVDLERVLSMTVLDLIHLCMRHMDMVRPISSKEPIVISALDQVSYLASALNDPR